MDEQSVRRRYGDRRDGRLLRSMSPVNRLIPYLIPRRADASAFFSDSAEIGEAERWLQEKRKDGWQGLGLLHVFLAAYVRILSQSPELNRFVSGGRFFARNGISVVLVGNREHKSQVDDIIVKLELDPTDTVFDVYHKLAAKSDGLRAGERSGLGRTVFNLATLPSVALRPVLWFLKVLDWFGVLPYGLLVRSPFHGSVAITALESAGARPFYHPLYPLGNLPLFLTIGARRKVSERGAEGEETERIYLDFQGVFDSRVADGYAWAAAMNRFREYLKHTPDN